LIEFFRLPDWLEPIQRDRRQPAIRLSADTNPRQNAPGFGGPPCPQFFASVRERQFGKLAEIVHRDCVVFYLMLGNSALTLPSFNSASNLRSSTWQGCTQTSSWRTSSHSCGKLKLR